MNIKFQFPSQSKGFISSPTDIWCKLILFLLLITYISVLVYLCGKLNLWEDEFYTLNTTSGSISRVISQSYKFENQPPGYFIVLKIWRCFNHGFFFARVLSVLFIILASYYFFKLVRLFSSSDNYWLLIIFLLNPFTIWAALDMRPYAFVILLSILASYFFILFFLGNKKKNLYAFLIIATIGLYTQYLFVFLIISLFLSFLIFRGWKAFYKLCLFFIPVTFLFLPNFLFIFKNIKGEQTNIPTYSGINTLYNVLQTPFNLLFALNKVEFKSWEKYIFVLFFISIFLFEYYNLYKKYTKTFNFFREKINFIIITVFSLISLYIFTFPILRVEYSDLYMALAFPVFILLFTIFHRRTFLIKVGLHAPISIYFLYLLVLKYRNPVKFYDFKSITQYILKIEKKNEPILFYRNTMAIVFVKYYKGHNTIIPLPSSVTYDSNYLKNIKDSSQLKHSMASIDTNCKSFLFVSDDMTQYAYSVNFNRRMVDDYLDKHYIPTLDTLLFGSSPNYFLRIRRFEKLSEAICCKNR